MIHVIGNALEPMAGNETVVIAHVCNNQGVMGAGFAAALAKQWPRVANAFHVWSEAAGFETLGAVNYVTLQEDGRNYVIANMVAQTLYEGHRFPLSMPHLQDCIGQVDYDFPQSPLRSIHAPRFGAGLARGHWEDIAELVPDHWHIYTLPHELGRFPLADRYQIAPELRPAWGGRVSVTGLEALPLAWAISQGLPVEVEI